MSRQDAELETGDVDLSFDVLIVRHTAGLVRQVAQPRGCDSGV